MLDIVGGLGEDNWRGERCSELVSKLSLRTFCLELAAGRRRDCDGLSPRRKYIVFELPNNPKHLHPKLFTTKSSRHHNGREFVHLLEE